MSGIALIVPNPDYTKSNWEHLNKYLDSSLGLFRILQLLDRIFKPLCMALREWSMPQEAAGLEAFAGKLNAAWTMLIIGRLPSVTLGAKNAVSDLVYGSAEPSKNEDRDSRSKIYDIADCVLTWSYTIFMIIGNSAMKMVGDCCSLITDFADFRNAWEDRSSATECLEKLKGKNAKLVRALEDTVNYHCIKIIKAVSAIASTIFGLMVLVFGGPVLPAAVLIGLGLTGTITAIAAHFLKATSEYKLIEFDKHAPGELQAQILVY